jgi:hypothetical protein
MEKKILLKRASMTGVVKWLNEHKEKQTKVPFTIQDVQQYIRMGHLPYYMGGEKLITNPKSEFESFKTYTLIKDEV